MNYYVLFTKKANKTKQNLVFFFMFLRRRSFDLPESVNISPRWSGFHSVQFRVKSLKVTLVSRQPCTISGDRWLLLSCFFTCIHTHTHPVEKAKKKKEKWIFFWNVGSRWSYHITQKDFSYLFDSPVPNFHFSNFFLTWGSLLKKNWENSNTMRFESFISWLRVL